LQSKLNIASELKTCSKCKEEKELSDFGKASKEKSSLKSACKVCCNKYYIENKERLLKKQNEYYYENKEYIIEQHKEYRNNNSNTIKETQRKYYKSNSEKIIKANSEYYLNNKTHLDNKKLERNRNRAKEDTVYKFKNNTRNLITNSFKRVLDGKISKSKRTSEILGCTTQEFINHLENLLTEGMTLKNHGNCEECWQIDHKIPVSSAKTEEEIIKLNHYTNLQPLWRGENLKKGNRY
jgi:F0F1-type ATP synthase membrane subunit b/b'